MDSNLLTNMSSFACDIVFFPDMLLFSPSISTHYYTMPHQFAILRQQFVHLLLLPTSQNSRQLFLTIDF